MSETGQNTGDLETRLRRLAEAAGRSAECHRDTVSAFHAAVREAEAAHWPVRRIAHVIGKSVAQTHRIMARLTGPDAD